MTTTALNASTNKAYWKHSKQLPQGHLQEDHVTVESLRERASVSLIEARHNELTSRDLERAFTSNNKLIEKMFSNHGLFKSRDRLNPALAHSNGQLNNETLMLIEEHNKKGLMGEEKYPTLLCQAAKIINKLIVEMYSPSPDSIT